MAFPVSPAGLGLLALQLLAARRIGSSLAHLLIGRFRQVPVNDSEPMCVLRLLGSQPAQLAKLTGASCSQRGDVAPLAFRGRTGCGRVRLMQCLSAGSYSTLLTEIPPARTFLDDRILMLTLPAFITAHRAVVIQKREHSYGHIHSLTCRFTLVCTLPRTAP